MKNAFKHAPIISGAEKSKTISLITDSFRQKILPLLLDTRSRGDADIKNIIEEVGLFYKTTEKADISKSWTYACLELSILKYGARLREIKRRGEKMIK